MEIRITPSEDLEQGTYLLPVRLKMKTDGIKLSTEEDHLIFVIKAMGNVPSTDKGNGIVIICYVECNKYNPLNAGEWTLRNSGKQLIDIVHLFCR